LAIEITELALTPITWVSFDGDRDYVRMWLLGAYMADEDFQVSAFAHAFARSAKSRLTN